MNTAPVRWMSLAGVLNGDQAKLKVEQTGVAVVECEAGLNDISPALMRNSVCNGDGGGRPRSRSANE